MNGPIKNQSVFYKSIDIHWAVFFFMQQQQQRRRTGVWSMCVLFLYWRRLSVDGELTGGFIINPRQLECHQRQRAGCWLLENRFDGASALLVSVHGIALILTGLKDGGVKWNTQERRKGCHVCLVPFFIIFIIVLLY